MLLQRSQERRKGALASKSAVGKSSMHLEAWWLDISESTVVLNIFCSEKRDSDTSAGHQELLPSFWKECLHWEYSTLRCEAVRPLILRSAEKAPVPEAQAQRRRHYWVLPKHCTADFRHQTTVTPQWGKPCPRFGSVSFILKHYCAINSEQMKRKPFKPDFI
jgi:hypothetical protein